MGGGGRGRGSLDGGSPAPRDSGGTVMRTALHLVRHGRTVLNAEGRFRGRRDPPLDATGIAQAEVAALRLATAELVAVYASPLRRAVETAEPIARLFGLAVNLLSDLIDLDYGAWEGLTLEEAARDAPDAYALFRNSPGDAQPPEGERLSEVETRVTGALRGLIAEHTGKEIVAVSHEVPIRLVLARLLRLEGTAIWELDVPTGSIAHLEDLDDHLQLMENPNVP